MAKRRRRRKSKKVADKPKRKPRPINWGTTARYLTVKAICLGKPQWGAKKDLLGWVIEFFGENTRPGITFEHHLANNLGLKPYQRLALWGDSVTMKVQVDRFNTALDDLDILNYVPPESDAD